MNTTKVKSLAIKYFRRFKDNDIRFGDKVTLIAGQNGTSKSTLLGMLAQPFSFGVLRGESAKRIDASGYIDNYHGLELHKYVDLGNNPFMYDCDDVFRLSKIHDFKKLHDTGEAYTYSIQLKCDDIPADSALHRHPLTTISRTTSRRIRFVTGPGASHKSGEGNFPHPVIYLGLNRLWPMAVAKKCTFSGDVSKKEGEWYAEKYNHILCLDEHQNKTKLMDTSEKSKFITPESSNYDGESCSAGQDNLGQILTAILSFRKLKDELKERYRGGLLLIDELDATFHAIAQDRILELLCSECEESGLQVVATTHSLYLLEKAWESPLRTETEVLCLSNQDGSIISQEFQTYGEMCDHMKVQTTLPPAKRHRRVSVVFEDKEGECFFHQICGTKLKNFIACNNAGTFGAGQLKNLGDMSKKLTELQSVVFVADGDMEKTWKRPPRSLVCLPGGERPETVIYKHLFNMRALDPFWKKCASTYSRQEAITKTGGNSIEKGNDKEWVKNWYRTQQKYWGRRCGHVFKSWAEAHKKECLEFCRKVVKVLNRVSSGGIPREVIEKLYKQYET